MSLVLHGDGVGRGCSKHGTYVWRSDCEECRSLPPIPYEPSVRELLTGRYDEELERMQTPEARRGMKRAFDATPEELAKAAVWYAGKYCDGCSYGSHCLGADPDCGCCKEEKEKK